MSTENKILGSPEPRAETILFSKHPLVESIRGWHTSVKLPLACLATTALIASILLGCAPPSRGAETNVTRVPLTAATAIVETPLPTSTPSPKPTEIPTATAEPTSTLEPTSTPEPVKEAPCSILPAEYCSQGELIYTKNRLGQPEIYVGFHLPPNVPIFAGMDGQVLKAKISQPSARQGLLATIRDPNLGNPNAMAFDTVGDLQFNDMSTANVKKGDIIGYTQDTGIKNYGDYNLVVTIRRLDPSVGYAIPAENTLKELFPQAFTKTAKTLDYEGPANPAPTTLSPAFLNGK